MADSDREIKHGRTAYILGICRCREICTAANTAYCTDRKRWLRTRGPLVPGWRTQLRAEREAS